ncbi:MAG: transcriptional regulator [Actinobacteria bacterium]|nr:transcriptional regulator [Actinomycetota bacterium]
MYSPDLRRHAVALMESGISLRSISISTGISRATLHDWREHPVARVKPRASCPRCARQSALPEPQADCAYLLGLYLEDGCLSFASTRDKKVWKLRIICADAWPGLQQECARVMDAISPGHKIGTQQWPGCVEVISRSRHWPCLFPQHGPGRKHHRKIELEEWQLVIVRKYPGEFARGLFHSDGWRGVNRVRRRLAGGDRWYEYPRYQFSNESADILRLCGETLDRLGVAWRYSRRTVISVARREAVVRLDEFVGPKY